MSNLKKLCNFLSWRSCNNFYVSNHPIYQKKQTEQTRRNSGRNTAIMNVAGVKG